MCFDVSASYFFTFGRRLIRRVSSCLSPAVTDEQAHPGEAGRQREPRRYSTPCFPISFAAPTFVPLPFEKREREKSTLPVRINLTIIRAISRCPPPQRGLTAQPGQTLHCSEHIMLTALFPGWRGPQVPVSLPVRSYASARARAAQRHVCLVLLEGEGN